MIMMFTISGYPPRRRGHYLLCTTCREYNNWHQNKEHLVNYCILHNSRMNKICSSNFCCCCFYENFFSSLLFLPQLTEVSESLSFADIVFACDFNLWKYFRRGNRRCSKLYWTLHTPIFTMGICSVVHMHNYLMSSSGMDVKCLLRA